MRAGDFIRDKIRSFLRIEPADRLAFTVKEELDFAGTAYMHKLWYRGNASELSQFYREMPDGNCRFWHSGATSGLEIRRVHTGIPKIMANKLAGIAAADFNGIVVNDGNDRLSALWSEIEKQNDIKALIRQSVTDMLVVGDGAFKISIDGNSSCPIIEWYSGEDVELVRARGRIREIIFSNRFFGGNGKEPFLLLEHYGCGYVRYELFRGAERRPVPLSELSQCGIDLALQNIQYGGSFIMAKEMMSSSEAGARAYSTGKRTPSTRLTKPIRNGFRRSARADRGRIFPTGFCREIRITGSL